MAHASIIASQQHASVHRGRITSTTWRAASRSLTSCRIRMDPDACVGKGKRKQSRLVRGAHPSIASQPSAHIWATRAHIQHHVAGSKPIAHQLQNQEGSSCMWGVRRIKTSQGSRHRDTCQHGQPATQISAKRAHNQQNMAHSKPFTYFLQNQAGSRCMCGEGQKKTKHAGQTGTC